jgi:hypothetical protein
MPDRRPHRRACAIQAVASLSTAGPSEGQRVRLRSYAAARRSPRAGRQRQPAPLVRPPSRPTAAGPPTWPPSAPPRRTSRHRPDRRPYPLTARTFPARDKNTGRAAAARDLPDRCPSKARHFDKNQNALYAPCLPPQTRVSRSVQIGRPARDYPPGFAWSGTPVMVQRASAVRMFIHRRPRGELPHLPRSASWTVADQLADDCAPHPAGTKRIHLCDPAADVRHMSAT